MRVMVLGLRGFPDVQGGVESHAEHLYPLLVEYGCEVLVAVRTPYTPRSGPRQWRGVNFIRLWSPRHKALEAIVHTLIGVIYAAWWRPDVLHIHAIGPALLTPLARLFGLRVVITHHGPDYDRQKWGALARRLLRLGESLGMRYSNQRIAISTLIRQTILDRYSRDATLIYNGVNLPELTTSTDALLPFGLEPKKYVILVGRLVPEKRHFDLIAGFKKANIPGWKLALVGGADHPDEYMRSIHAAAAADPRIVCTGFQRGETLRQLYAHAGIFVLPSSHEGLPIALLEALSYGLPTLSSDIPANLEVGLDKDNYFPLGDTDSLARALGRLATENDMMLPSRHLREWVASRYNWKDIARQTFCVYQSVLHDVTMTR